MATPQHHTSHQKKNSRRAHQALKPTSLVVCPNCGSMIKPHIVCPKCGYYDGKKEVEIKVKEEK